MELRVAIATPLSQPEPSVHKRQPGRLPTAVNTALSHGPVVTADTPWEDWYWGLQLYQHCLGEESCKIRVVFLPVLFPVAQRASSWLCAERCAGGDGN